MQGSSPQKFMSLPEAAAWAGVSPRTVRRWIDQGLPHYQARPRCKVLIWPADIEQFLTRQQQTQQPDLDRMVEEVFHEVSGQKRI